MSFGTPAQAKEPPEFSRGVKEFTAAMISKHRLDSKWTHGLMDGARYQQKIIDAISRPAEGKPWHEYREIFLTQKRISGGVEFWNRHRELLERAERTYGVPAQVIVSIIGVETNYGGNTGGYRVVDALSTLAFAYPKRAPFFRSQLEDFLLLLREEKLNGQTMKGSYAGAIGMPQFMPESWRKYAVDFDGDGRRDLAGSAADVIGSVANYLARYGWKKGEAITTMLDGVDETRHARFIDAGMKPSFTIAEFRAAGLVPRLNLPGDAEASLVRLEASQGEEYWAGLENFYAITRYNHSNLYAMAVFQLAEAIDGQRRPGARAADRPVAQPAAPPPSSTPGRQPGTPPAKPVVSPQETHNANQPSFLD